jgi:hypothetical protein
MIGILTWSDANNRSVSASLCRRNDVRWLSSDAHDRGACFIDAYHFDVDALTR